MINSKMLYSLLFFLISLSLAQEAMPFDAPDQAVWHAPSRTWFISNLGGGISLAKDSNAWITQVDEAGKVINPCWIGKKEGMHALSGMTITDSLLFVCDRDGVYEIDIESRKVAQFYKLEGAEFINDIARSTEGDLYVSDFFGNRIYKIPFKTKKAEVWLESPDLQTPDGLYIDNNALLVASWGVLSKPNTFETSELGDLLSIDLHTKKITTVAKDIGNLEGITKAGDHYYISDWAAGKILKIDRKGKSVTDFICGLKNPTDPDFSKELNTIAFPQHGTDQVFYLRLN